MGRWHGPGEYLVQSYSLTATPRRRLKALKRLEADERNAKTPPHRRRAYRRLLQEGAALATTGKRRKKA